MLVAYFICELYFNLLKVLIEIRLSVLHVIFELMIVLVNDLPRVDVIEVIKQNLV